VTSSTQTAQPFRLFEVELTARTPLSENFARFTFTGPTLDRFADNGYDQRIKLMFPRPGEGFATLLASPDDWYTAWRELDDESRPPMRTYTIRAVRPSLREIDIDIVLHGLTGVASAWATTAPIGSPLLITGPNADFDGVHGGIDFHLPPRTGRVLVAGDETALPAIANIIEALPASTKGCVLLEVPADHDATALPSHDGLDVIVVGRGDALHGEALIPLVKQHAGRLLADHADASALLELEDVDVDEEMLWEVPEDASAGSGDAAGQPETPLYAWLAGEAGVIKTLRRHLVAERGVDRRSVAFMGYWRSGKSEQN